ncbi:DUF3253 domain-containing protein [Sphingomonas bisphenolicum]|uniref:DUF3253 domain-containing protein n=1 Tax=Sphingomonas bisphenolicum TaxID=296544 RepID=UPI0021C442CE|nr:DUF3253 domain-containing protein [Sphingomonas bisphenolicum]
MSGIASDGDERPRRYAALLAARAPGSTVCPSEVARAIAPPDAWRDAMPTVHAAVDRLRAGGLIQLSWKGEPLAERVGPYRIRRKNRN